MPTYEYRCASCEHQFERFQRMTDEAVKECEVCGAPVQRMLFPVAIHFKGKGFYTTDYARRNNMGTAGTSTCNGGGSESSSGSNESGSGDSGPSESSSDRGKSSDAGKSDSSKSSESVPASSAAKES